MGCDGRRLVATCWTTAGAVVSGDVDAPSPVDVRRRVEAAAAAGFRGLGLNHPDLMAARARHGDAGLRALLADHGIEHLELEVLTDWYATGEPRRASDERRRDLLDAAEKLGARLIKAIGLIGGPPADPDRIGAELAGLAAQAAAAGARVGIESSVAFDLVTPADVLAVVERADHPGAGVVLDNWQVARAGVDPAELRSIPARQIAGVELSDGPARPGPDLVADCFDHRGLPGSGELDLPGFVAAVAATGYDGPWAAEILEAGYRGRPLDEAVAAAHAALARALAWLRPRPAPRARRPVPGARPGPLDGGAAPPPTS